MAKHTTICAGIDTGKRKLDVAITDAPSSCRSTTWLTDTKNWSIGCGHIG